MEIREIMSTHLHTIEPGERVSTAAQMMAESDIGCLIVIGDGVLEGVVTDRDIVTRCVGKNHVPQRCKISDHMTSPAITVEGSTDIIDAARIMTEEKITRLPVIEEDSMVGLASLSDMALAMDMLKSRMDDTVHDLLMGMGGRRSAE